MNRSSSSERQLYSTSLLAAGLVVILGGGLILYKVLVAIRVGPPWDTYAFLSNAAEFAGRGFGYTELHRPPFMSWIVSLLFRTGLPLHESVIQWVDGAFALSGLFAFYLLARRRFEPTLAAIGALGLFAFRPLWQYVGAGYTDFASVSLSMWVLLSCIWATERHRAFYLIAGPMFVAAALTRYTAILALFPTAAWIFARWHPFRQARAILATAVMAGLAYLPAARFYGRRFGDALFPFILAFGVSESLSTPMGDEPVTSSALWYLKSLPAFLGAGEWPFLAAMVLFVAVLGIVLGLGGHLQKLRPRASRVLLASAGLGLLLAAQLVDAGLVTRQLTILAGVSVIWRALAPYEGEVGRRRVTVGSALDAAMLVWFLAYFDAHGHQGVQVQRYVITMAPALTYFVLLGFRSVFLDIRRTVSAAEEDYRFDDPALQRVPSLVLGAVLAVSLVAAVRATPTQPDPYVTSARESAVWLLEQPGASEATVYSDLWPLTSWYAGVIAQPMPFFTEDAAFQHELDKESVDYYVTTKTRRYDGYEEASRQTATVVLHRTRAAPEQTRVLYLGKAWDNYLEVVTDFSFYLTGDPGAYGWEGTAFLDAMSAEQLSEFPAVALFNVRWRNRAQGEAVLLEYMENGGTVVMDASANLGELPYEMGDTVVFDTVVRRRALEEDAAIWVQPSFVGRHPELEDLAASPFVNENGATWYGADYSTLPGTAEPEIIATVGSRPAVLVKRFGKGRLYLIGYNLVWHSFITENDGERALVRMVFDEALEPTDSGGATYENP